MSTTKTIKSALISVFSKDGLEPIVKELNTQGVTIYSTGGTEKFIKDLGIKMNTSFFKKAFISFRRLNDKKLSSFFKTI